MKRTSDDVRQPSRSGAAPVARPSDETETVEHYYRLRRPPPPYGHLWVVESVAVRGGKVEAVKQITEPDVLQNAERRLAINAMGSKG